MIRRPPRSTPLYSSAASDVYKRQLALEVLVVRVLRPLALHALGDDVVEVLLGCGGREPALAAVFVLLLDWFDLGVVGHVTAPCGPRIQSAARRRDPACAGKIRGSGGSP